MSNFAGRTVLALAMVASLALVAPVNAGAKTVHPPLTMPQYRVALHQYQLAKNLIDRTFHDSIAIAKATEVAAMAAAKTPAQKYLARVDFNEARATDVANWQTALHTLGPPPQSPLSLDSGTNTSTVSSAR